MVALTLAQDARTETFEDLKGMIFDLAWRFSQQTTVEFEEAKSLAFEAFLECFPKWEQDRGPFPTYVNMKIRSKLYEFYRVKFCRHNRCPRTYDYDLETHQTSGSSASFLVDFLDELSEDAQAVVKLTVEAPTDVIHCLLARNKSGNPVEVRNALEEVLSDCGWAKDRIFNTFSEISAALN